MKFREKIPGPCRGEEGGNISSMNKKETDKMAGRKNGII